jgi:NAD(P)-dependent dehydrogenase (short-subunit alcohol dehydrogenase family)
MIDEAILTCVTRPPKTIMATDLITGANRGIGYAYCQQLHDHGDRPIAVCRTPSPELEALAIPIITDIDVTQEADVDLVNVTRRPKITPSRSFPLLVAHRAN